MPKKSKGKSTSAGTDQEDSAKKLAYDELIALDPDFFRGEGKFDFPNGDKYEGEFCAHASGLIWRQGAGTYTTLDGQAYTGQWDGDKFVDSKDVEISYPDGSKFVGNLSKSKYSGTGVYYIQDKVSLTCDFVENKPSGEITLIDPNEHAWHGFAQQDESLLIPEHAFYAALGKDLGKGKSKKGASLIRSSKTSLKSSQKSKSSASSVGLKYSDLRDVEKSVFAKTKKTPSDLQFESSEWYQEYLNYKNTYGAIVCKVLNGEEQSLSLEESTWYKEYEKFAKKYQEILGKAKKEKPIRDEKLFELIHSREYKKTNRPVPVFFPSTQSNEECDYYCECAE